MGPAESIALSKSFWTVAISSSGPFSLCIDNVGKCKVLFSAVKLFISSN